MADLNVVEIISFQAISDPIATMASIMPMVNLTINWGMDSLIEQIKDELSTMAKSTAWAMVSIMMAITQEIKICDVVELADMEDVNRNCIVVKVSLAKKDLLEMDLFETNTFRFVEEQPRKVLHYNLDVTVVMEVLPKMLVFMLLAVGVVLTKNAKIKEVI